MMSKYRTLLSLPVCGLVVVLALAIPAHAQDKGPEDVAAITKTITNSTNELTMSRQDIFKQYSQSLADTFLIVGQAINDWITNRTALEGRTMPHYDSILTIIQERSLSRLGAAGVNAKLDDVMYSIISGHSAVENAAMDDDENPLASDALRADTKLYEILITTFCDPDSAIAPTSCINRAKQGQQSSQSLLSFVDVFLGERTWSDKSVLDTLLLARRFFAGSAIYDVMGNMSEELFITNRGQIAQANLRMSILNDLAARRAPTSTASGSVLNFMFRIMADASPLVASVNPDKACSVDGLTVREADSDIIKAGKFFNGYLCSYVTPPTAGSNSIISQAAIDRIMQHDFYMSSRFYNDINSIDYNKTSMERMEVFMKAQQLAQDYRQLHLLKMKVAATAMNMMNQ